MMHLLSQIRTGVRSFLGLDWLSESKKIASESRKQREIEKAKSGVDPHDFARWLQDPRDYRTPRRRANHETK